MKDEDKGITWTKIQGSKVIFKINSMNLGILFLDCFLAYCILLYMF